MGRTNKNSFFTFFSTYRQQLWSEEENQIYEFITQFYCFVGFVSFTPNHRPATNWHKWQKWTQIQSKRHDLTQNDKIWHKMTRFDTKWHKFKFYLATCSRGGSLTSQIGQLGPIFSRLGLLLCRARFRWTRSSSWSISSSLEWPRAICLTTLSLLTFM